MAYLDNNGLSHLWSKLKEKFYLKTEVYTKSETEGLIPTVPTKVSELTNDSGFTTNVGTITGVKMNNVSKGTSGVVDLGTVITSHQSIKTINSNTITGTGNVSVGTITGIKMNGASKGTSGVVDLGTVITSHQDLSAYALKSDIASMYKYKGSVATVDALPSTGNTTGDVYNVEADDMNYAWNGTVWDALGGSLTVTSITNAEIDSIIK